MTGCLLKVDEKIPGFFQIFSRSILRTFTSKMATKYNQGARFADFREQNSDKKLPKGQDEQKENMILFKFQAFSRFLGTF